MENDQVQPIQPSTTPIPTNITQSAQPMQPKQSKLPLILLGLISLLSLSGLVYFYMQTQSLKHRLTLQPSTAPNTPTTSSIPSQNTEITTNWQKYTSPSKPVTTIQYPPDWKIDEKYINDDSGKYLFSYTVSKDEYSITFSFPSGFGPGICIFNDQPEFSQDLEPGPGSTKCPGDYVEIKSNSSTFRRLATPPKRLEDGSIPEWGIYTRDPNGNYVTVPPIAYKVPGNPDVNIVKLMDQILSTFEP